MRSTSPIRGPPVGMQEPIVGLVLSEKWIPVFAARNRDDTRGEGAKVRWAAPSEGFFRNLWITSAWEVPRGGVYGILRP